MFKFVVSIMSIMLVLLLLDVPAAEARSLGHYSAGDEYCQYEVNYRSGCGRGENCRSFSSPERSFECRPRYSRYRLVPSYEYRQGGFGYRYGGVGSYYRFYRPRNCRPRNCIPGKCIPRR
jgi:hypothetical protein